MPSDKITSRWILPDEALARLEPDVDDFERHLVCGQHRYDLQDNCPPCETIRRVQKYVGELRHQLAVIRATVDEQAEDEALWFDAETISEAYLQAALRRLHEAIEGKTTINAQPVVRA